MIKIILQRLDSQKKADLMHAFENDISKYCILENNRYVGVNLHNSKHLKPLEEVGVWSYGLLSEKIK